MRTSTTVAVGCLRNSPRTYLLLQYDVCTIAYLAPYVLVVFLTYSTIGMRNCVAVAYLVLYCSYYALYRTSSLRTYLLLLCSRDYRAYFCLRVRFYHALT